MVKNTTIKRVALSAIAFFGLAAADLDAQYAKKVLIEEGTNASCPPCAAYNPAFKAWMKENYTKLIPVTIHASWPGPNDPMYRNDMTLSSGRVQSYYNMTGVPSARIDGFTNYNSVTWPGDISQLAPMQTILDARYGNGESPVGVTVTHQLEGNNVKASIKVNSAIALSGTLRVYLMERLIESTTAGNNGETEFDWVARTMAPNVSGTPITVAANGEQTFEFTMPKPTQPTPIDNQLYVVAFVQKDDATKEVLNAGSSLDEAMAPLTITSPEYTKVAPNSSVTAQLSVSNTRNEPVTVNLSPAQLPAGWSVTLDQQSINLPANGSATFSATVNAPEAADLLNVTIEAIPQVTGSVTPVKSKASFYTLHEGAKYVVYGGLNSGFDQDLAVFAALRSSSYGSKSVYMPFSEAFLNAYPSSNFDVAVLSYDYFTEGQYIASGGLLRFTDIQGLVNDYTASGKHLFFVAEATAGAAKNNPAAQQLLQSKFGITAPAANPTLRVQVNGQGQITGLIPFSIKATSQVENFAGFTTQANNNQQGFTVATDILQLTPGSTAKPILYYDDNQTNIGGVAVEENGSRRVFLSFMPLAIGSASSRQDLTDRVFDYLLGATADPVAIASDFVVDFGEVQIGKTSTKTFTISAGNSTALQVNSVALFDGNNNDVSVTTSVPVPATITSGTPLTVTVEYTPSSESSLDDVILVETNDPLNESMSIIVGGQGVVGTSVKDGEVAAGGMKLKVTGANPFAENTRVEFSSASPVKGSINLYNTAGNLVGVVASGELASSTYVVDGSKLAAGTYIVRVESEQGNLSLPVVRIR